MSELDDIKAKFQETLIRHQEELKILTVNLAKERERAEKAEAKLKEAEDALRILAEAASSLRDCVEEGCQDKACRKTTVGYLNRALNNTAVKRAIQKGS